MLALKYFIFYQSNILYAVCQTFNPWGKINPWRQFKRSPVTQETLGLGNPVVKCSSDTHFSIFIQVFSTQFVLLMPFDVVLLAYFIAGTLAGFQQEALSEFFEVDLLSLFESTVFPLLVTSPPIRTLGNRDNLLQIYQLLLKDKPSPPVVMTHLAR